MESLCKGLSGMDAARAAMGQGWPFAACPWSNDGVREPRRRRGRMSGNVINLSCSPAQGKPPEAASRHGRRAMTRPLPLNQAV